MIVGSLGVTPSFDVALEARRRIDFVGTYLRASGLSGGVDSLAAALLAQRAVEELRATGFVCTSDQAFVPHFDWDRLISTPSIRPRMEEHLRALNGR